MHAGVWKRDSVHIKGGRLIYWFVLFCLHTLSILRHCSHNNANNCNFYPCFFPILWERLCTHPCFTVLLFYMMRSLCCLPYSMIFAVMFVFISLCTAGVSGPERAVQGTFWTCMGWESLESFVRFSVVEYVRKIHFSNLFPAVHS